MEVQEYQIPDLNGGRTNQHEMAFPILEVMAFKADTHLLLNASQFHLWSTGTAFYLLHWSELHVYRPGQGRGGMEMGEFDHIGTNELYNLL